MPFSYATAGSGPSAGGIGWFDFGNLTLAPGQSITGLTGLLNNNDTVTFDISSPATSQLPYTAVQPNIGYFGTAAYTGITGNVALYNSTAATNTNNQILISNIVVRDGFGNPVTNYSVFVADAESTDAGESWNFLTNGPAWSQFAVAGPNPPAPTLTGIGTNSATITGTGSGLVADYVLTALSPTAVLLTSVGRQAVAIGFAVTRVTLLKNIGGRIDPSDQFQLNVTGTPSAQTTTTGSTTGLQTVSAQVNAIPGNSYTLSEAIAPGSASALTDYTQTVTVVNFTPGGSMPPTGTLPINFTPTLGDDVFYVIRNTAPNVYTKTVDKAFANVGDVLTYTISVDNPNDTAINNVLVQDATPFGTTYLGNITASQPYTGTDLASGITFTTIPANTTATVSWQVQINSVPPMPNPIPNMGMVSVAGGTASNTNVVTTQVNTAFLTVTKAVNKLNADVGDTLTYTITLNNAGDVAANNVVITDAIPAGTTFVAGSVTGATGTPPTLTLANPIPAGGTATVSFQVLVDNTIPNPNPVLNTTTVAFTYTVDPATPDGANGTATSNTASTQVNNANLNAPGNFVKSASPASAGPGDVITYTLAIQNTGNVPANNVVITDNLPAGTTFVPGSVTGATGNLPTLTLSNPIPAGGSATVTFQVRVNADTTTPVSNTASVNYAYTVDPANPNGATGTGDSNTVSTQVNYADVTTTKTVSPANAQPGGTLTYTITLQNNGNVDANNVVITDQVPAGTTFVAGSVTGATGTPPTLTVADPIPAGGTATVTFQVLVDSAASGPISNTASTAYTYTADPANPNSGSGTSQSEPATAQVNRAALTFAKSASPAAADVNGIITYTFNIQNTGNVAANNVVITDQVPTGTTFVAGSVTGATGTPPTLTVATIPAGGTATVTFQVQVDAATPSPTSVSNSATAAFTFTVDPANPNGATGTATSNTTNTPVNNASLTTTKTADKTSANLGDVITYTIALNNTGNTAANNVVITDNVPAGTTFVPGSVTGATGTPPTLTVATVPAGGNATVTFQVKVGSTIPATNPIANSASVAFTYTVDPSNPNGASGTSQTESPAATQINAAVVTADKTASTAFAGPGDIITYTIALQNTGNADANNAVLTDNIPAGTTFVPGSLTGATGTLPTLTLANPIAAGGTATVTFQVQVGANAPSPLSNTATANFTYTADPANPNGATGTAVSTEATTQVNVAALTTTKTSDKAYAKAGDVITYTVALKNTGNTPANNVVITDAIPAGTSFVAGSTTGATGAPPTLTLANPVAAGSTATVTFQVLVGDTVPNPNPVQNTASVAFTYTANPADPNGASGTSQTATPASTQVNFADIAISKTATPSFIDANGVLTYTITLQNNGNAAATNVVITDPVPAGTTFVPGSVTGATGTPPTLTVATVPGGGTVTVTYQVKVGATAPSGPVLNTASAAYRFTVDPANPNAGSSTTAGSTASVQVNTAKLNIVKAANKKVAYIGDVITYQLAVTNSGNVNADNVVITDLIPGGTQLVAGSLTVGAPYSGDLGTGIALTGPIAAGQTIPVSFQIRVTAMPNPNPILNTSTASYAYTVDPAAPDGVTATASSNTVTSTVFRYNFGQQINDIIESVALEEAALANIANAEGAKIQAMVAMPGVTTQELLCLNKSVSDMMDSIAMLEAVLKQKLSVVNCQLNGTCM